jgi:hypothetical protein
MTATPPRWAEGLLRACLRPDDFDCTAGDLLEHYRESVVPEQGHRSADRWYVRQVFGFMLRSVRWWGTLLAAAFVARTALDWLVPTTDFHGRSTASTLLGVGLFLFVGFSAGFRSGAVSAGPIMGFASAALAALLSFLGAATLLAVWHDPTTMVAIRGSGGLEEVFTLPIVMLLPGTVLGTVGGVLGLTARRLRGG